jgi:hypothetical protein
MKSFLPLPAPLGLLFRGLSLHRTRNLSVDHSFCLGVFRLISLPVGEGATATLSVTSLLFVFVQSIGCRFGAAIGPNVRVVRRRTTADVLFDFLSLIVRLFLFDFLAISARPVYITTRLYRRAST